MKKRVVTHGTCFVCGEENPFGLGLTYYFSDGKVHSEFKFKNSHQGPPGHAHGGAIAAVLDEAMGASVWIAGFKVLAASLEIKYRRPVPLNQPVEVLAWKTARRGRKIFAQGELRVNGQLCSTGRGFFVEPKPGFFPENIGELAFTLAE